MDALQFFKDFIAIESISTDPDKKHVMEQAVQFLVKKLTPLGFVINIIKSSGHPLLVASLSVGAKKTLGFYSHYDVQPAAPLEKWHSPPFELTPRDGNLYGRGSSDDKMHIVQVISALEKVLTKKTLHHNIMLIYEGEEEIGSTNFESGTKTARQQLLPVDAFYILDSNVRSIDQAMILYGLRGLLYYEITLTTTSKDLHSGLYGNTAPNPALLLCQYLSSMKDHDQKVTIAHFYEDVKKPSKEEFIALKKVKPSLQDEINSSGCSGFLLPSHIPYYLASKTYPSFDINGMISGYIGEGQKTIIPSTAMAKFSFRLVPEQNLDVIHSLIEQYTKDYFKNLPVSYKLLVMSQDHPFVTEINNPYVTRTKEIFSRHFAQETLINRSGGSIPAAEILSRNFNKPVIITGFVPDDSNLHGPDEHTNEKLFYKGIDVLVDLIA